MQSHPRSVAAKSVFRHAGHGQSRRKSECLVLIADPAQLRTIENIVRELDQPRAQVLIHAAIVEISGDINDALGVQWGLSTGDVKGFVNFPGTGIPPSAG